MSNPFRSLTDESLQPLAWKCILAAREALLGTSTQSCFIRYVPATGEVVQTTQHGPATILWQDTAGHWQFARQLPDSVQTLFALYLPVLGNHLGNQAQSGGVVAHLGQSIDARIATLSGDSFYVTGEENRKHLHCLRALSDAVIVGAGTVVADDPQLTTRAVAGRNPVRVIVDPRATLDTHFGVFRDGQARTVLVHQSSADTSQLDSAFGPQIDDGNGGCHAQVQRWVVPDSDCTLPIKQMVALLVSRGLKRLFVEGGGVTVSRFFEAGALHRLHLGIAPLLVGQGIAALQLSGFEKMQQAHRPPHAIYKMGDDVLWDFDLRDQLSTRTNEAIHTVATDSAWVKRID